MPSIAGLYNPQVGALLQVAALPPSSIPSVNQGNPPTKDIKMFMALLDTGASSTCLSKNVIDEIGLNPIGKTKMSGATGATDVDKYNFCLGFMFDAIQEPTGVMSGALQLHLIDGCEFSNHGFGFDILIGRDILCKGAFSMSFDGHFVLSI